MWSLSFKISLLYLPPFLWCQMIPSLHKEMKSSQWHRYYIRLLLTHHTSEGRPWSHDYVCWSQVTWYLGKAKPCMAKPWMGVGRYYCVSLFLRVATTNPKIFSPSANSSTLMPNFIVSLCYTTKCLLETVHRLCMLSTFSRLLLIPPQHMK